MIQVMNANITKTIFVFGSIAVAILLLFLLEEWSLFASGGSRNHYLVFAAIVLLAIGAILSRFVYLSKDKHQKEFRKSSLSDQELRVLQFMADGLSNKQIASNLFIAESTVKSHVSNIFSKLDAKRRTEAVRIGRELEII